MHCGSSINDSLKVQLAYLIGNEIFKSIRVTVTSTWLVLKYLGKYVEMVPLAASRFSSELAVFCPIILVGQIVTAPAS